MLLLLKCPRTQLMAKFTIHATSVCLCVFNVVGKYF